jgi:RNA polymerase sigma-70 factor (ECF subfamily)
MPFAEAAAERHGAREAPVSGVVVSTKSRCFRFNRCSRVRAGMADNDVVTAADDELSAAIERAQQGDPLGFEALFRTFGGSVAGYLRARGVTDPDGIANDVFLRVFRAIHTFQGDSGRFRSWVFTIAHNAAIDDARRRRRRVQEAPLDRAPEAAVADAEAALLAKLAHERVHGLLSTLSTDQHDVVVLRIVNELSVSETAAVLGKSVEAVKALQHRGLGALRRAISSQEAVSP